MTKLPEKSHINPENDYYEIMDRTLKNFQKITKEKNLAPYRVAKDLGLSASYFYNWTKGRSMPTLLSLCSIAEYLGITVTELMGYEKSTISDTEVELLKRFNSLSIKYQVDVIAAIVNFEEMQRREDVIFRERMKQFEKENDKK